MDFVKYLLAIALWAVFYLVVGFAAAFGVMFGINAAKGLQTKIANRKPKEPAKGGKVSGGKPTAEVPDRGRAGSADGNGGQRDSRDVEKELHPVG